MEEQIEVVDRLDAITQMEDMPIRAVSTVRATSPLTLLHIAVERGTSMDQLERLMALQTAWETREAEKAYNRAFAAFKAEAVKIIRNREVSAGPLSGKKYAELFAVVNAVTPALSAHGLSASWKLTKDERDWLEVTCTLKHEDGHAESVSMGGPPDAGGAKNAIQARASTVSYLERYTLKAITGLSEQNEDDDGNAEEKAEDRRKRNGIDVPMERLQELQEIAADMLQLAGEDRGMEAVRAYYELPNNDEKMALWGMLKGEGKGSTPESRLRALIKANSPHAVA